MRFRVFSIALAFVFSSVGLGFAQKADSSFEIGLGIGEHHFAGSDDAREGAGASNEAEVKKANFQKIYFDWFFGDGNWGIGYHVLTSSVKRDLSYTDGTDTSEEYTINSDLYVINYVLSFEKESKWVAFGGIGSSQYKYNRKVNSSSCGLSDQECSSFEATANGDAKIAGLYYDHGGPGWGFRVGADYLMTDYGAPENADGVELDGDLDATGYLYHVDVRYAF